MLERLKIGGFRSIHSAELRFGRVNLFIGGNGVGKSNILEAIGVLSSALGRGTTSDDLQLKGVRLSPPPLFKSNFKNTKPRKSLDLYATFSGGIVYGSRLMADESRSSLYFQNETLEVNKKKVLTRDGSSARIVPDFRRDHLTEQKFKVDLTKSLWEKLGVFAEIPDEFRRELNIITRFAIYSPQAAFLRGTEVENRPLEPLGLKGGGLPRAAYQLLAQRADEGISSTTREFIGQALELLLVPGWAESVEVRSADPVVVSREVKTRDAAVYFIDRFMRRGRESLSAYDASEGTLFLLFIAVLLAHEEAPRVFALDNVDNALNPRMTRELVETIVNTTCDERFRQADFGPEQVFLTSHNPTALDAFDLFDDDQRVFVVFRDEKTGMTKLERLQPPDGISREEWIRMKGGKNLSELWVADMIRGALG